MIWIILILLILLCLRESYTVDRIARDWIKTNKDANTQEWRDWRHFITSHTPTPQYNLWSDRFTEAQQKRYHTHVPRIVSIPDYGLWSDRFNDTQQRNYKIKNPSKSYWGGCYIDGDRARPSPCFVFGNPDGRY